jgi:hypothetical protein
VGEGLFTEYTLPNGKKAFMYYNGGGVMDEAEVAPTPPPPRPTSVPLALQQTMPLGNVLNKIARPPSRWGARVHTHSKGDRASYGAGAHVYSACKGP